MNIKKSFSSGWSEEEALILTNSPRYKLCKRTESLNTCVKNLTAYWLDRREVEKTSGRGISRFCMVPSHFCPLSVNTLYVIQLSILAFV